MDWLWAPGMGRNSCRHFCLVPLQRQHQTNTAATEAELQNIKNIMTYLTTVTFNQVQLKPLVYTVSPQPLFEWPHKETCWYVWWVVTQGAIVVPRALVPGCGQKERHKHFTCVQVWFDFCFPQCAHQCYWFFDQRSRFWSVTAYWSVSDRLYLRFGVGLRFVPDSCSSGWLLVSSCFEFVVLCVVLGS